MPDNTPHHKAPGRRREAASAAAARAWRRFERALATSIADSTPGAEITLWAGTRGPAVEIGVFLDEDVEVKAFERACGPGRRAGKDQARRLAALGFERVEQEGPDDEPPCALSCFRRPMVHPVAGKDVAALAVVVLREVMGFAAPSALQYSATAMVPQNVALPGLGLEQLQALFGGGEDVDLHGPGKPTLRRQVAELVKARTGRRSVRYTKEGVLRIQGEDAEVVLLVDEERGRVSALIAALSPVAPSEAALAVLNEFNSQFSPLTFSLAGDTIVLSTTVNGSPFVPEHLDTAIQGLFGVRAPAAEELRARLDERGAAAPVKAASRTGRRASRAERDPGRSPTVN